MKDCSVSIKFGRFRLYQPTKIHNCVAGVALLLFSFSNAATMSHDRWLNTAFQLNYIFFFSYFAPYIVLAEQSVLHNDEAMSLSTALLKVSVDILFLYFFYRSPDTEQIFKIHIRIGIAKASLFSLLRSVEI